MTRKHFRALANALRLNIPDPESNAYAAEAALFENIVKDVARACGGATVVSHISKDRADRNCQQQWQQPAVKEPVRD